MSRQGASYRAAGVDYDALDAGKRLAMAKALSTSALLGARGGRALDASRGEPAFVFELGGRTFAFVVEGLGTKSIIARAVLEEQGVNRFADVAYDTVAAILNDLCCVGALPLVVNAYFATGASEWYAQRRPRGRRCSRAGAAPARTRAARGAAASRPRCPGLLDEREIELAGAAVGAVPAGRSPILGERLGRGRRDRARGLQRAARQRRLARAPGGGTAAATATPPARRRQHASGRRCWRRRCMYVRLVAALLEREVRADLHQPRDRSRTAQADAPAACR